MESLSLRLKQKVSLNQLNKRCATVQPILGAFVSASLRSSCRDQLQRDFYCLKKFAPCPLGQERQPTNNIFPCHLRPCVARLQKSQVTSLADKQKKTFHQHQ